LNSASAEPALKSFSLNPPRSERKRWEYVLAAFAGVGSPRTHDLETARKPAQTPTAKRNGTGRSVPSGTGRTRSISGQTICRRNWTLLASVNGVAGVCPVRSRSPSGLPQRKVQEVIGLKAFVIIEYLAQLLLRRFQEVIRVKVPVRAG
jgi:hypothetical protein